MGLACTDDGQGLTVLGSCFAFRRRTHFLTAAHCLGDLDPGQLEVLCPGFGVRRVEAMDRHARADLAFLITEEVANDDVQPLSGYLRRADPGADVTVYGFPEDVFGPLQGRPVPRVLRTHVQRVMPHASHMGFRYEAAELGLACPPGVSGGPVLIGGRLVAVAAEVQTSTTVVDSVETVTRDGTPMVTVYQRLIEYGVSVLGLPVRDWLRTPFQG